MGKLEREIKVLNIDIETTKEKLEILGATYKGKKEQKIYTYDVPSINYRFYEAIELLKSDIELMKITAKKKLEIVICEFRDLVDDDVVEKINEELSISNLDELLNLDSKEILDKVHNSKLLLSEIDKININPNKWVRLRKSNDKVELTVKHIFNKNDDKIQKVEEYEISVSDLEKTNEILEQTGLVKRNYQEKIRYSYSYKTAEIEIDLWPNLEPYMEIECDEDEITKEIVDYLEFNDKRIVSLNTEQLYKEKGIDILKISELKF